MKTLLLVIALVLAGCDQQPIPGSGMAGAPAPRFVEEYRQAGPGALDTRILRDTKTGVRYIAFVGTYGYGSAITPLIEK